MVAVLCAAFLGRDWPLGGRERLKWPGGTVSGARFRGIALFVRARNGINIIIITTRVLEIIPRNYDFTGILIIGRGADGIAIRYIFRAPGHLPLC